MDENGLHNDFDDREIRSGDSYDELGITESNFEFCIEK